MAGGASLRSGVAPAVVARNHGSGRPRAHRPTLLRGSADGSAGRGPDERRRKLPGSWGGCPCPDPEERCRGQKSPRWSAERRAGRRHRPVIPGDPGIGPTARRATGCGASAPAPVGAPPPSFFRGQDFRGARLKAHPTPFKQYGRRSLPSSPTFPNAGAEHGTQKSMRDFTPTKRPGGDAGPSGFLLREAKAAMPPRPRPPPLPRPRAWGRGGGLWRARLRFP
jgi:hypothetical protein